MPSLVVNVKVLVPTVATLPNAAGGVDPKGDMPWDPGPWWPTGADGAETALAIAALPTVRPTTAATADATRTLLRPGVLDAVLPACVGAASGTIIGSAPLSNPSPI